MDPHVVDCHKIRPDKFALAVAAATRGCVFGRGANRGPDLPEQCAIELELKEIAGEAFTGGGLLFLGGIPVAVPLAAPRATISEACGDGVHILAPQPSPARRRRSIDDPTKQEGEMTDAEVSVFP